MLLLPFIPIIALLIQTSSSLYSVLTYRMEVNNVKDQVLVATDLGRIVTRLQLERGDVAFYIFTNGNVQLDNLNLTDRFQLTDETIESTTSWEKKIETENCIAEDCSNVFNKSEFIIKLSQFRNKILKDPRNTTVFKSMLWYWKINSAFLDRISYQIKESDKSGIWRYLISLKTLIRAIENIGVSAVYGISYYSQGYLPIEVYVKFLQYDTLGKDLLNSSLILVPFLKEEYKQLTNFKEYGSLRERAEKIIHNKFNNGSIEESKAYYLSMTEYINQLRKLHTILVDRIK